jgi:hypothetical protein
MTIIYLINHSTSKLFNEASNKYLTDIPQDIKSTQQIQGDAAMGLNAK